MREVKSKQVALAYWPIQPTLVRIPPGMPAMTAKAASNSEQISQENGLPRGTEPHHTTTRTGDNERED